MERGIVRGLFVLVWPLVKHKPLTSAGLVWLTWAWWVGGDTSTPMWCVSGLWLVTSLYTLVIRRLLTSPG